jgi:ribosomal protein S18 acetylase RimI-like enzyme
MEKQGGSSAMKKLTFIWETPKGQIAGVLHPEDMGQAFLQINPKFRTAALEKEMLSQAEKSLSIQKEGDNELTIWALDRDNLRQDQLRQRGYRKGGARDYQWYQTLERDIPAVLLPAGFELRPLGDKSEWLALNQAHWQAFHLDEAQAPNPDANWYKSLQLAPLYRRDLDLVVLTQCGELVAFSTIWFDDATRSGMFEPVGTVPNYQRKGLATTLMLEGLNRLKARGALRAHVGTVSEVANHLYNSVGFRDCDLSECWVKTFKA